MTAFGSLQEFFAMGGHGLYVWLSYGAAAIIVLYNVLSVRRGWRRFFEESRDRQRRHGAARHPLRDALDATDPRSP